MTNVPAFLPELLEADATGRIADIYAEIRLFSGVSYVSSLQRYLATIPGVLEWVWDALRPAIASGAIPEAGWRIGRGVRLPPVAPVTSATIQAWDVDAAGLAAIRNVAANFVRVAPVNLMMGACLSALLNGARPKGGDFPMGWRPPNPLPPMPGNVDFRTMPADQRAVLLSLGTEMDGVPFVPALYRQIAHWPPVLSWLATELLPRFAAPETRSARTAFQAAARKSAPAIVAKLPAMRCPPPLDADTTRQVLVAIGRYAETSPEMTLFGQLILDALPVTAYATTDAADDAASRTTPSSTG